MVDALQPGECRGRRLRPGRRPECNHSPSYKVNFFLPVTRKFIKLMVITSNWSGSGSKKRRWVYYTRAWGKERKKRPFLSLLPRVIIPSWRKTRTRKKGRWGNGKERKEGKKKKKKDRWQLGRVKDFPHCRLFTFRHMIKVYVYRQKFPRDSPRW